MRLDAEINQFGFCSYPRKI